MRFYILGFVLSAVEASFFPTVAYMGTVWFAQHQRARNKRFIYLATTIVLIIRLLSGGVLMKLDNFLGLQNW